MKPFDTEFSGKRVLITGGSRGIGAAVSRQLCASGALVAVAARRRQGQTASAVHLIQGDLSTLKGAENIAAEALELLGGLDLLVNNAGATAPRLPGIEAIADEDWIESLMINFMSAVRVTRPLLPALKAGRSPAIVNVSAGSLLPFHGFLAHYGAGKAALESYTRSLAKELAPDGVRVNLVTPGAILTPGGDEGRRQLTSAMGISVEQLFKSIPLEGRPGQADEMAEAIVFLLSERASYITGHDLFVTGGYGELA